MTLDGPGTPPAWATVSAALRAADVRVFSSEAAAPRARRPTDVLLLVVTGLAVLVVAAVAPGPTAADDAVVGLLAALPGLLTWFWAVTSAVLVVWAVLLVLAAALGRRRLVLEQALGLVAAFAGALVTGIAAGTPADVVLAALLTPVSSDTYPGVRLAVAVAVVATTSPHLSRPLRQAGRWIVLLGAVGAVATGATSPLGATAGVVLGVGAGAAVNLAFGSPGGRLSLRQVAEALADLGVEATELRHADLAARGVGLVTGRAADGRPLLVKIYGRDAWDGQLIASLWSWLWYRDTTPWTRLNRLQQVEHEAFATLFAERAGVAVLPVVAAGLATGRDALLVLEAHGRSLAEHRPEEVDDAVLDGLWSALRTLHRTGIAHGRLTPERLLVLPDGAPAFGDFGAAVAAATDTQKQSDRAELLVSTALVVGPDRAVRAAADALGADAVGEALPLLQSAAIEPSLRRAVRTRTWDTADLRTLAAGVAGRDLPELERLRRVTPGSALRIGLVALVAYVLVSAISGVGWDALVDELSHAHIGLVIAAVLVAPFIQLGYAFSTIGASERPVRLGPALLLQYSSQFLGLVAPSAAARVALAVRFFQRAGATTTGAVAVGLIDSLCGFAIQLVIIVTVAISGVVVLELPGRGDGGGFALDGTVLLVVAVGLVGAVLVALAVPRVRAFVRSRTADGRVALRVLHSRRNVVMLVLGNLAAQCLFAVVLGLSLWAFDERATFAELLLINTLVSLFAGLMPVPGGIGVTEAALTAGLVAVGVPGSGAISAALVHRLATFYVPPLYGMFALRWLRRAGEV